MSDVSEDVAHDPAIKSLVHAIETFGLSCEHVWSSTVDARASGELKSLDIRTANRIVYLNEELAKHELAVSKVIGYQDSAQGVRTIRRIDFHVTRKS